MSWFNIFRKVTEGEALDPCELDKVREQAKAEVDRVLNPVDTSMLGVAVDAIDPGDEYDDDFSDDGPSFSSDNGASYSRRRAKNPTLLRGTKDNPVTPLRDWQTISNIAEALGLTTYMVDKLIVEHDLDTISFVGGGRLAHARQVSLMVNGGPRLRVDTTVFDGWERQGVIATVMDLDQHLLTQWSSDGTIATYKPSASIVLHNVEEVYRIAQTR